MQINPIELKGNWDEGWALDRHTVSSDYIGENPYGRPIYDTVRTEIGELLYQSKYRNGYEIFPKIMEYVYFFLDGQNSFISDVDFIIPVPYTNKNRSYQPAFEIAFRIAENYKINTIDDINDNILVKVTDIESKDMGATKKDLRHTIRARLKAKKDHNILLVDDLFDTGATLHECVRVLKEDPHIKKIYVLAMTKTKRG